MLRRIFFVLICLFSIPSFSKCDNALPIHHPNFCSSFKQVAFCHCNERKLPSNVCSDPNQLYKMMISIYKTLENACSPLAQTHTSQADCVANWKCYGTGNATSPDGKKCLTRCEVIPR